MHTFSHLDRKTYQIIQIGIVILAIFLWFMIFAPIAI
jgi:hypothetical protein